LADLIEGTCHHARHFAKELKAAGYPILHDVVLNQFLAGLRHFSAPKGLKSFLGKEKMLIAEKCLKPLMYLDL